MPRQAKFKPLLFTTTVRSPERIKGFLSVLKQFEGQILNNNLATVIVGELIRKRLYKPINLTSEVKIKYATDEDLTDEEVSITLQDNPQKHKEAGFTRGWPSRFDTQFKISKELGLIYYAPGVPITFSSLGNKLIDIEHPEYQQAIFQNAFSKYHSNNPFRRVLNKNIPLVLLLKVIKLIDSDSDYNSSGISRQELPLVIYWKDDNAESLYHRIKQLRTDFGYTPSDEVICDICRDEIMEGEDIVRDDASIMNDYPDEFIRKMRLTGLITVRGYGRFIDLNTREMDRIDYIIANYSTVREFINELEYYNFLSQEDEEFFKGLILTQDLAVENEQLRRWVEYFQWDVIKRELIRLSKKELTSNAVLKFISAPLRLEFLISLAVICKYPSVAVVPNYIADDEGLPSNHAPGNNPDIECTENDHCALLEVTLMKNNDQVIREMPPISRHLDIKIQENENSVSFFIAPSIHVDTVRWCAFIKHKENLTIIHFTIDQFINKIENNNQSFYINAQP